MYRRKVALYFDTMPGLHGFPGISIVRISKYSVLTPLPPLTGVFQLQDPLRYRRRKTDEEKVALVVQVVLAAFIHDAHQIVLGRARIGNNPVDLAGNQ